MLASAQSLTAIIGPLIGTTIFSNTQSVFVGTVWLMAAALDLLAAPVLLQLACSPATPERPAESRA